MSPTQQRLIKTLQFTTDAGVTSLLLWLCLTTPSQSALLLAAPLLIGFYRLAVTLAHYSIRRPFWDELRELVSTALLMASLHVVLVIGSGHTLPMDALTGWLLVVMALPLSRNSMRQLLRRYDLWHQPILLVGNGPNSKDAKLALHSETAMGYRVVSQLMPDANSMWLQEHPHAMVAIALEPEDTDLLNQILRQLTASGRDYLIVPALRGLPLQGLTSFHTFSHEVLLLRASNHLKQLPSQLMKRLFDYVGAIALTLLLTPVLAVLAGRLALENGPILFWHDRVGRQGKFFRCPKFRTMSADADTQLEALLNRCEKSRDEWEATRKLRDDPRVTALGSFLRKTSLDELPQLWCVLKGEMSLVGPRPVTAAEMPHYAENKTYYEQVLPGITGLWQVSGRSEADYPTRVALDVWYVRNWSLWTDVVILLKTASVVILRKGAY
jgi:Undecaprenyl-phosphate galactose phosphotransferase WbaP